MSNLQKRKSTIRYFHAYGKVCLTVVGHRIQRAPNMTALDATHTMMHTLATPTGIHDTNIWAVGMALCLPANRDSGTRVRGKVVAAGRVNCCLHEMCPCVDTLPESDILWRHPVDSMNRATGQYIMNEDALEKSLLKLEQMERDSMTGVRALTVMIENSNSKGRDDKLLNTLRRIRKLAAANDGSAGLYKAYKEMFNTGSL
jgi:hypothetical protein